MNNKTLIGPCGMNCAICSRYLSSKNKIDYKEVKIPYCSGCRVKNKCAFQKKCNLLNENKINFCFECNDFPCERLQKLDDRYRANYKMSMINNLKFIKQNGISKFLKIEKEKWQCSSCKGLTCCHNGLCFKCDLAKLKNKKQAKLYRWERASETGTKDPHQSEP